MIQTRIVTPKVVGGFVSRQTNLGIDSYDLNELYSPDTELWKSKVLDLGSPKYPPQIATAPQRYWFDRSRYNNHGAITGAIWKQLPSGVWVMSFDGLDDRINCGAASSLNVTNITILMWIKPNGVQLNDGRLIDKIYSTAFCFVTRADNTTMLYAKIGGLGQYFSSTGPYILDAFNQVGVTYNGVSGSYYINALNAGDFTPDPAGDISINTQNLMIGSTISGTSPFKGIIGEVRIYNRALTPLEIKHNYLATRWSVKYGIT